MSVSATEPRSTRAPTAAAPVASACIAVVVHWTDAPATLACVRSLHEDAPGLLVIVVDNASVDGSGGEVAERFARAKGVEVLRSSQNDGFGAGCNRGIRRALETRPDLEQVLLVNPDAIVERGCIAALRGLALRSGAGVVGGRVLDATGERVLFENGRFRPWTLGRSHVPAPQGVTEFRTSFVTGALMLIDGDLLRDGLHFDETFFLYVEDLDLCREVVARGRELWITTAARVRHREGGSQTEDPPVLGGMRARQLEHIARGKVYFARKRLPFLQRTCFLLTAFVLRPIAGVFVARNLRFLRPWLRGAVAGLRLPR